MAQLSLKSDIVLATPSDIRDRVTVVERAISNWNAIHSDSYSVIFRPRRWERDVFPAWSGAPQECINNELVDQADGMIALFWHRLGSATPEHVSGTAEEIERFAAMGKQPAVYVCKESYPPSMDPAQLQKLRAYESELEFRGLVFPFRSDEELQKLCFHYLTTVASTVVQQYRARPAPEQLHGGLDEIGDVASLTEALTQMVYLRRQFELLPERIARRGAKHPDVLAAFGGSAFERFAINFEEVIMRLPEHAHTLARPNLVDLCDLRAFASRPVLTGGLTLQDACHDIVPSIVDRMLAVEDLLREMLGSGREAGAA